MEINNDNQKEVNYDKSLEYNEATQTLIGTRKKEYLDLETGEKILVDAITKRVYGTKNFWKCYLMDFLTVLGIMDNKQVDIFVYIVANTEPNTNLFIGTYSKIAKDVNVSRPTIAKIMKKLQENNFLKLVQDGVWRINPNILMRGNDTKRQILLSYYNNPEPVNSINYNRVKSEPIQEPFNVEIKQPQQTIEQHNETDSEPQQLTLNDVITPEGEMKV